MSTPTKTTRATLTDEARDLEARTRQALDGPMRVATEPDRHDALWTVLESYRRAQAQGERCDADVTRLRHELYRDPKPTTRPRGTWVAAARALEAHTRQALDDPRRGATERERLHELEAVLKSYRSAQAEGEKCDDDIARLTREVYTDTQPFTAPSRHTRDEDYEDEIERDEPDFRDLSHVVRKTRVRVAELRRALHNALHHSRDGTPSRTPRELEEMTQTYFRATRALRELEERFPTV